MPDEAVHFRIKPEYKRLYFDVFVWASRRAMHDHLAKQFQPKGWKSTVAAFVVPAWRARNCLGEIHFNRKWLDYDTIAHEAQHAALAWAKHKNLDVVEIIYPSEPSKLTSDAEERLCEAVGALCMQISLALVDIHDYFKGERHR